MKKWMGLVLTLCLLVGTLAGCTGNAIVSYDGNALNEDTLRYQIYNTKLGLENQMQILSEDAADAYWAEDNTTDLIEGKTPLEYATSAILKDVKEELMIVHLAKEYGVSADAEKIASIKEALITQMFGSQDYYEQLAEIFGFTDENLEWIAKVNADYSNILEQLYPRDQLATYAEENGWVRVKHVLIKTSDTVSEADALKKAQEVCDRAANGESFDTMVSELSEDPGSTTYAEGYLVALDSGMTKSFETAALALAEGEVSAPVKSDYGYHVLKRYPIGTISDSDLSLGTSLTSYYQEEAVQLFQEKLDAAMTDFGDDVSVNEEKFKELIGSLKTPNAYYEAINAAQQAQQSQTTEE